MSKTSFLLAVLCCCLYVGVSSVSQLGAVSDPNAKFIYNQILKSATPKCPDIGNQLLIARLETQQCVEKNFDPDQNSTTSFVKEQFKLCANPVTSLLGNCLPEKSAHMGEFFVDTMVNIYHVVFNSKRSDLLAVFNRCITRPTSDRKYNNQCKLDLQMRLADYEEDFPTKEEFCRFQSTYRACLHEQLEKHCTRTKIKDNFFRFFDRVHTTCDNL